jgi:hypothetical protein
MAQLLVFDSQILIQNQRITRTISFNRLCGVKGSVVWYVCNVPDA